LELSLASWLKTLLHEATSRSGKAAFLVLDQFEKFLCCAETDARRELCEAINEEESSASFLLVLRDDAVAALDVVLDAVPDIFRRSIRLHPLSAEKARIAITRPLEQLSAESLGVTASADPAFVEMVVSLLTNGHSRSVDPLLLQIVMRELWHKAVAALAENDQELVLRESDVEEVSVERALEAYVERGLDGLSPERREAVIDRFDEVVSPGGELGVIQAEPSSVEAAALEELVRYGLFSRYASTARAYVLSHRRLGKPFREWCVARRAERTERSQRETEQRERANRDLRAALEEQGRVLAVLRDRARQNFLATMIGGAVLARHSDFRRVVWLSRRALADAKAVGDKRAADAAESLLREGLERLASISPGEPEEGVFALSWRMVPEDLLQDEKDAYLPQGAADTPRVLPSTDSVAVSGPEPGPDELLYGPTLVWRS